MRLTIICGALLLAACTSTVINPDGTTVTTTSGIGGSTSSTTVTATGASAGGTSAGPATPRPSATVSLGDPSGAYVITSHADYPTGAYIQCATDTPQLLKLTYSSGEIDGYLNSSVGLSAQVETLGGTYVNGVANLTGQFTGNLDPTNPAPVTYVLTFNPKTQHFVGTRDGVPVWAAPFLPSQDPSCFPSPTPVPEPTIADGTIIPGGDPD